MRTSTWSLLCIIVTALVGTGASTEAQAASRVHIWLRAFIPKPAGPPPAYYSQASDGRWLIRAPNPLSIPRAIGLPSGCFSTDDRSFDASEADVLARVTVDFDVVLNGGQMSLDKHAGGDMRRVGLTRNVDCASGKDLQPPRRAEVATIVIGSIKTGADGSRKLVNIKASTGDPFYTMGGLTFAPKLDFEIVVTFDPGLGRLEIVGVTGSFPAFEAYYRVDQQPTQKIFQLSPSPKAGAGSLADLWLGLNSQNFSTNITIAK